MEQHSNLGYSAVSIFDQCPYRYKLRYIDKIKMLDEYDATDPLRIGTALHRGLETNVETAIREYFMGYPVINDLHMNEAIKLEIMIKKVKAVIPDGKHEVFIKDGVYKGTIDLLASVELTMEEKDDICYKCGKECEYESSGVCPYGEYEGYYDMYDFKYSNNIDKYMESQQLHVYKYYAEKALNIKINRLYFVFAQKVMIRQKKTEDLNQFRMRLKQTLQTAEVTIKEVSYDANKVIEFMNTQVKILTCKDYIKQESRLCDWCEYQSICQKKEDIDMALPSTNRVQIEQASKKKIWIYGVPFSGKTTFADQAPTPLNLNTDGNVKYVTMPRLPIKDEVTVEGRITKRKYAWEVFEEAISDLEKGSDFETIVVDILDDIYDSARIKTCVDKGWEHESDDSFKAYDFVRSNFLRTMKRLLNLDYNVILISHEDASKDIMKKGGDKITSIQPNIPEKVAKKLAGMVDLVGRVVVDGDKRSIVFKSDEVVFGGGRLQGIKTTEIPLSWDAVCKVYDEAIGKQVAPDVEDEPEATSETKVEPDATTGIKVEEQPTPTRRTRRTRND